MILDQKYVDIRRVTKLSSAKTVNAGSGSPLTKSRASISGVVGSCVKKRRVIRDADKSAMNIPTAIVPSEKQRRVQIVVPARRPIVRAGKA